MRQHSLKNPRIFRPQNNRRKSLISNVIFTVHIHWQEWSGDFGILFASVYVLRNPCRESLGPLRLSRFDKIAANEQGFTNRIEIAATGRGFTNDIENATNGCGFM